MRKDSNLEFQRQVRKIRRVKRRRENVKEDPKRYRQLYVNTRILIICPNCGYGNESRPVFCRKCRFRLVESYG